MFHITAEKNLKSILEKGLIPKHSKGLTCGDDAKPVVWLTDNPQYILDVQCGSKWIEDNKPVILEVDCKKLDIKQRISYHKVPAVVCKHEYYYEGTIKQNFGVKQCSM
jgi:RNA:NAD 2'-phosphotransferase (TPT1/KptA family)